MSGGRGSRRAEWNTARREPRPPDLIHGLLLLPLLALLLAFLGPFLGALAVAGADLALEQVRPRQERPHLAEARHHLHPLPDAHLGHLAHQRPHLVELG